uniref:Uncharacterized protein n=1 Tax=Glossina morsitans morsitans TaxID=37546 RepID=A0A1B0GFA6_GLOMM
MRTSDVRIGTRLDKHILFKYMKFPFRKLHGRSLKENSLAMPLVYFQTPLPKNSTNQNFCLFLMEKN